MAKDNSNTTWIELSVAALSDEQRKAYEVYKDASRRAAELRAKFEELMQSHAPEGKKMVFGYRFGKLSAALVDGEAKAAPKAKTAPMSLSQFIAMQSASGRRV